MARPPVWPRRWPVWHSQHWPSQTQQTMPLLVVAIMSQLVFSGGMIPVTDRLVLDQLSWLTPARWGLAATASTVDLIRLVPGPLTPQDSYWKHTSSG